MSYRIVNKRKGSGQYASGVAISCVVVNTKLCLMIRLSGEVLKQLNASLGDRILIEVGEDDDTGWIRITKTDTENGFKLSRGMLASKSGRIYIKDLAMKQPHLVQSVEYYIKEGSLYVKQLTEEKS